MKTTQNFITFNPKGLAQNEINFLAEVERLYLSGEPIRHELAVKAMKNMGTAKGKKLLEAWEYWEFLPRPILYKTYLDPVPLSSLFHVDEPYMKDLKGNPRYYTLTNHEYKSVKGNFVIEETVNVFDIHDIHFRLYEDGRLYLEFNTILGSRFIGFTKDDIFK